MGYWNHRVVKRVYENGEEEFSIREVFYNDSGEVFAYTMEPIDLACESLDSLKEYIGWCLKATEKEILVDGKVEFANED